ncbi:MAG: NAD(P)/FAD-dependent oxidoreductase [Clostridia bacterium]|nr:NAD(P)/FAD-dependent oxidoreductase [Clostridia bacterium]MDD4376030.1 NAD(P)/FAD-dependent oxidoreductase [Clostridia bacterium]
MSRVIVIGAGPAGMVAALEARKNGHEVILLEKNNELGKKLNITGKGRCNVTYVGDNEKFLNNVVNNAKFLTSSINTFNNIDLIKFLNEIGIDVKEERGSRVFLKSDNAKELTERFNKKLKEMGVKVLYRSSVKDVISENNKIKEVILEDNKSIKCDACIIATGGKSYPGTGSTGAGYKFAKNLGHNIIDPKPALVGLKVEEQSECKKLQGLSLKNVEISIKNLKDSKIIYKNFGEMLFTHFGCSGPLVLSASSTINGYSDDISKRKIELLIDLKPALSKEMLYKRLTRDFTKYTNKNYENSLNDLLPKSIIPAIILRSKINADKKVNQITKEEKENIVNVIKEFKYIIMGLLPIETGIVTAGGVSTKEINPKTMESKIVKNLYFAGEVIDLDAYTGGYNLQIAFTTGFVAGNNIN